MHIKISPQSIDHASNRVRGVWQETRKAGSGHGTEPEGLHTWLARSAVAAWQHGDPLPSGKLRYAGMKFSIIPARFDKDPECVGILDGIERIQ